MKDEKNQIKLGELRIDAPKNEVKFKKCTFGGFEPKEVTQYILVLRESLQHAERSFNERVEEYASSSAMLLQERDKYMSLYEQTKSEMAQLKNAIDILTLENEKKSKEQMEMQANQQQNLILEEQRIAYEEQSRRYEALLVENELLKEEQNSRRSAECEELSAENAVISQEKRQLELRIEDLTRQIETVKNTQIPKEQYEVVVSENEQLRSQYDEILSQNSILTAERNVLAEQNARLEQHAVSASQKNKELHATITKIKFKTRKMIADSQAKVYECSQNHEHNIDLVTEHIQSALTMLTYEKGNIIKLLTSSMEEILIDEENGEGDTQDIV